MFGFSFSCLGVCPYSPCLCPLCPAPGLARGLLASDFGATEPGLLSDDFKFVGPLVGPLKKVLIYMYIYDIYLYMYNSFLAPLGLGLRFGVLLDFSLGGHASDVGSL